MFLDLCIVLLFHQDTNHLPSNNMILTDDHLLQQNVGLFFMPNQKLYCMYKLVGSLTSHNTILSKIKQISTVFNAKRKALMPVCVVSTPIQGRQFASSCKGTWWVWENDRMPKRRGRIWVKKENQLDLTGASQQVPTVDIQTRKNAIDQLQVKYLTKVSVMVQKALFNVHSPSVHATQLSCIPNLDVLHLVCSGLSINCSLFPSCICCSSALLRISH